MLLSLPPPVAPRALLHQTANGVERSAPNVDPPLRQPETRITSRAKTIRGYPGAEPR
jgi:hypothetical protein